MTIPAVRIQDAILDELENQVGASDGSLKVKAFSQVAEIEGQVDVLAIAVRIAQLVNDR